MGSKVFISYSARDRSAAEAVCAALESGGIPCWIAPRDILPSKDWGEAIVETLNQCRIMVLLFSSHSNESLEVRREVQYAFDNGVAVLPVRIENVRPSKGLQYYLNSVHWFDAIEPIEPHLPALTETVARLLAPATAAEAAPFSTAGLPVSASGTNARVALRSGPLAYATPFPPRAGRRGAWLAMATFVAIVPFASLAVFRWRAAQAASVAARSAIAAVVATPPARTTPPLGVQGSRAVTDVIADFTTLDSRLATLSRGLGAGADESARGALLDLTHSSAPFLSCVNVYGATGGFAGRNDPNIPDRVEAFHAVGADPRSVRQFAERLFAFTHSVNDLQSRLDDLTARRKMVDLAGALSFGGATASTQPDPMERLEKESAQRELDASAKETRALAAVAYVSGLRLLGEVRPIVPQDFENRLGNLKNLEPRHFPSDADLLTLAPRFSEDAARATAARQTAEADEEQQWGQVIDAWSARLQPPFQMSSRSITELARLFPADTPEQFRVTQTDTAATAAGRAADARRNGWDGAAVVDFFSYAASFAATDPAAEDYARAAAQYDLQRARLGIPVERSILYVSNVASGPDSKAGLRTGDLLLSYAGNPVTDPETLAGWMRQIGAVQTVQIEFLRRDDKGRFNLQSARVDQGSSISAGFIPI